MTFSEPVNGVIEIWSEDTPLGEIIAQRSGGWFYSCGIEEAEIGIVAFASELREIATKLRELNHAPRMVTLDLETAEWALDQANTVAAGWEINPTGNQRYDLLTTAIAAAKESNG